MEIALIICFATAFYFLIICMGELEERIEELEEERSKNEDRG